MTNSAVIFQRTDALADIPNIYRKLIKIQSLFPFTPFPDTLSIDTDKITITKKLLFVTEYCITIPFKDILDVTVQTASFFATITIVYTPQAVVHNANQPVKISISYLRTTDALKAKDSINRMLGTRILQRYEERERSNLIE